MTATERIKELCKQRGIPIYKLEKDLGFSNGYIGQLKKGSIPSDRLHALAEYFDVSASWLATGEEEESVPEYYLDEDARELAIFLHRNPDYKVLFDASRKVRPEDIGFVKQLLDRMGE